MVAGPLLALARDNPGWGHTSVLCHHELETQLWRMARGQIEVFKELMEIEQADIWPESVWPLVPDVSFSCDMSVMGKELSLEVTHENICFMPVYENTGDFAARCWDYQEYKGGPGRDAPTLLTLPARPSMDQQLGQLENDHKKLSPPWYENMNFLLRHTPGQEQGDKPRPKVRPVSSLSIRDTPSKADVEYIRQLCSVMYRGQSPGHCVQSNVTKVAPEPMDTSYATIDSRIFCSSPRTSSLGCGLTSAIKQFMALFKKTNRTKRT